MSAPFHNRTYFIESLGCIANRADTARVASFLEANGYTPTNVPENASVVVLMTCAFDQLQEDRNMERVEVLQRLRKPDSQLVVGGCLPAINKSRLFDRFPGPAFTPRTMTRLNSIVSSDRRLIEESSSAFWDSELGMQVIRISTGCMHQCTFCAIPMANGRTMSRSVNEIVSEIMRSAEQGSKSFRLVSEDVAAYGLDRGSNILELMQALIDLRLPIRVYLDYMQLQWVHRFKNGLLRLLASDIFAKHLYWPVQSGSDRILQRMKRGYTVHQVRELLEDVFTRFPSAEISTDLIVGFPSETEEDFTATRDLLSSYPFWYCNIFKYEERPFTEAPSFDGKISDQEKERRLQILVGDSLTSLFRVHQVSSIEDLARMTRRSGGLLNVNSRLLGGGSHNGTSRKAGRGDESGGLPA